MSRSGSNTERIRSIALALPETHEGLTWGEDVIAPKRLAKQVRPPA